MTALSPRDPTETDRLLASYAALVHRYHKALDLVSEVALRELPRHVDDALAYARRIEAEAGKRVTIVDVGSGAGLPGIPIAISLPAATVHLVERRRRRVAFLELATAHLGLKNTNVFQGDVRDLGGVCADVITAQAVADLATIVDLTRHLHGDPCLLLSRRGDEESLGVVETLGGTQPLAEGDAADAELTVEPLKGRGSLVALRLPGGQACRR